MLSRRFLGTQASSRATTNTTITADNPKKWKIKHVTNSTFSELIHEIKANIFASDFVAISLQKTGSYSAPWQKVLPFDTADIAYLKAKYAAERFQVFQFAVCPFRLKGSTLTAYPYNFLLFPRDELNNGMPSYSFSCQTSYMASMARVGFDFNECIYNGISYLSRAQESLSKHRVGMSVLANNAVVQSSSVATVADSIFLKRVYSRIEKWREACKSSGLDDDLVKPLRKIVSGSEEYGSRPSMVLDVCSEHQAQLVLNLVLKEFHDNIVPLLVTSIRGTTQAIRVVLASTKEDKIILETEIKDLEEQKHRRVRGFREVIDLMSSSQKPIVAHNKLEDFTFIHSKFLEPLPHTIDEFNSSLKSYFPHVLDLSLKVKEITPRSLNNVPAALVYIKNRFIAPIDVEIPHKGFVTELNESNVLGHNVLRITQLFAKLSTVLKRGANNTQEISNSMVIPVENYTNNFTSSPTRSLQQSDDEVRVSSGNARKLSSEDLVFLWGFRSGLSAGGLKRWFGGSHRWFSAGEFDIRLVDASSAVVAFWQPGVAKSFIESMESGGDEVFRDMVSDGVRVANYETYKRVCSLSIWESSLADSLDKALSASESSTLDGLTSTAYDIYWDNEDVINLDDL